MTFEEMCLDTRIMRAIAEMGFESAKSDSGAVDTDCGRGKGHDRTSAYRNG